MPIALRFKPERHAPQPRISTLLFAAVLSASLTGCSEYGVAPAWIVQPTAQQITFTDEQLRAAAYPPYYRMPGFYQDDRPAGTADPYYVNTVSTGIDVDRYVELSTNDIAQAREWAATSFARSSGIVPIDVDAPRVTERFFEFVPAPGTQHGVPFRVHRRSYLDRAGIEVFRSGRTQGIFGVKPVRAADVRGLAEYLWVKDVHARGPLASVSTDLGDAIVHSIFDVDVSYSDWEGVQSITLRRLDYRVDKRSGTIALEIHPLRSIGP